ncbi:MAG: hypothetical protein ACKPKO_65280, partial [Candidatus Fonsibacter sp.]
MEVRDDFDEHRIINQEKPLQIVTVGMWRPMPKVLGLEHHHGAMLDALRVLFLCISGGERWALPSTAISAAPLPTILLSMLSGINVEAAMQSAGTQREFAVAAALLQEALLHNEAQMMNKGIAMMFDAADDGKGGIISKDNVFKCSQYKRVKGN